MQHIKTVHPGAILLEEFLVPLEISVEQLAQQTLIHRTVIQDIIEGTQRITPDTASRLSKFFGISARFWLGLQEDYEVESWISRI